MNNVITNSLTSQTNNKTKISRGQYTSDNGYYDDLSLTLHPVGKTLSSKILASSTLDKSIADDYIGFFRDSPCQSDGLVLKFFLKHHQNNNSLAYAHSYIAKETGLSIATVKRSLGRLADYGVIQSWLRPYRTCFYVLNEFFKQKSVLSKFKLFFIGFMSFTFLMSANPQQIVKKERELLLILKDIKGSCTAAHGATAFAEASSEGIKRTWLFQPQAIAAEFYNQAAWHQYQESGHPPNNKLSDEEMDEIFYGGRICISADAGLLPNKKSNA